MAVQRPAMQPLRPPTPEPKLKTVALKSGFSSRGSSHERTSQHSSGIELDEELRLKKAQLKGDVNESPQSKQKYRLIQRDLKEIEKALPFDEVIVSTLKSMASYNVPQKIHWRIYLDLADLAKRESRFEEARAFFKIVVKI